jgi:hypothetical protein
MKRIKLFILLLFVSNSLLAQDKIKTEMLHPTLGETINKEEKQALRLFPFVKDSLFDRAFLFSRNDTCCFLEIDKVDGKTLIIPINSEDKKIYYKQVEQQITKNPGILKNNVLASEITLIDGTVRKGLISKEDSTHLYVEDVLLGSIKVNHTSVKQIKPLFFYQRITLTLADGGTIKGRLYKISKEGVQIENSITGIVFASWDKISSLNIYSDEEDITIPTAFSGNPNATRFLFAPSAIPLKKGEGYYQNIYFLFNSVNYGLTNHLSISGGLIVPFAVFANVRISGKVGKYWHFGTGIIGGTSIINLGGKNLRAGIGYGLATAGNENNNISVGTGWAFAGVGDSTGLAKRPIVTINGILKLSKRVSLVTENWIFSIKETKENSIYDSNTGMYTYYPPTITNPYYNILSAGARFRISPRSTMDFAILKIPEDANFSFLPYLDFVYHF